MFDHALAATDSRGRDRIEEREADIARADVDRLARVDEIIGVVLDETPQWALGFDAWGGSG